MSGNGLVSIVIPVYNVRPYIEEALDSVVFQDYGNLEIIIVDDGSTDGSGEVCDEYAARDGRVTVIHQENRGLSAARNAGLDRVTGEAVAFLDPDDAYCPNYVEAMHAAMVREGVDLVVCQYTMHTETGRLRRKGGEMAAPSAVQGRYDRAAALRALADGAISHAAWNKLYRRGLWRDMRFPEGHVYEDVDTTYRILDRCKAVFVLQQPLYLYRRRPGSITDTVSMRYMSDRMQAYSHYVRFIEENTRGVFTSEQRNRVVSSFFGSMIAQYARCLGTTGEKNEALTKTIIAQVRELGINTLNLRARTAYRLLRVCPWLLRVIYPVYLAVRKMIWRITGR